MNLNKNIKFTSVTTLWLIPLWIKITLPASSVTAHLIGRSQTSNSTAAATVSQQAMLLGNRPANCNQAQMYLRTQMVPVFLFNVSNAMNLYVYLYSWFNVFLF